MFHQKKYAPKRNAFGKKTAAQTNQKRSLKRIKKIIKPKPETRVNSGVELKPGNPVLVNPVNWKILHTKKP